MSARRTVTAHIGLGLVAVTAFGFLGAAPASAHTGALFTVYDGGDTDSFATISQTDASVTPLANSLPDEASADSIEIFNEQGWAIGEGEDGSYIYPWDHSTGLAGTPVPIVGAEIQDYEFSGAHALDTLLDGTIISFGGYNPLDEESELDERDFVGSIDPVTGVWTPLVELTDAVGFLDSLATDPTTGITYALVDEDDGTPQFIIIDFAGSTYAGPTALPAIEEALGEGWMRGADFDTSGTLWFFYDGVLAHTTGAFTAAVSAVEVGPYVQGEASPIEDYALAYDPAAVVSPQLADTGVPVASIAGGALALLVAGGVLFAVRRRTEAV